MIKRLLLATVGLIISCHTVYADCVGIAYGGFGAGVRVNTRNSLNYRGIEGTLFLGYGAVINPAFALAGEIFASPASIPINNNGLQSTYSFGISALPALMITEHSMLFFRLGAVLTKFTAGKKTQGLQAGVGIQTGLTENWDLRGEYIFSKYRSISTTVGSPISDQAMMSLVYKFL